MREIIKFVLCFVMLSLGIIFTLAFIFNIELKPNVETINSLCAWAGSGWLTAGSLFYFNLE